MCADLAIQGGQLKTVLHLKMILKMMKNIYYGTYMTCVLGDQLKCRPHLILLMKMMKNTYYGTYMTCVYEGGRKNIVKIIETVFLRKWRLK